MGALYRGGELLAAGKIEEARDHLERAHELDPKNEKAQNLLGLTYFKLNLFEPAARVYEQLVHRNPQDPTLRVNLGLVYLKLNDTPRAIREFEAATNLEPTHKKAHNYLGLALAQAGAYASAREHFILAGSDVMAEKMLRAIHSDDAGVAPSVGSLTPLPSAEFRVTASVLAQAMPRTPAPLPPPPEPNAPAPVASQAAVAPKPSPGPAAPPAPSDARALPKAPAPLAQFHIEERVLTEVPAELRVVSPGAAAPLTADAPSAPGPAANEAPPEVAVALPEPAPVLDETAVELVATPSAEGSATSEGSVWLTEHLAEVPLGGQPLPTRPRRWTSPSWVVDATPEPAPAPAAAPQTTAPEPPATEPAAAAPAWPEPSTAGAEVAAPAEAPAAPPGHAAEAKAEESHWVLQPASRALASDGTAARPAPTAPKRATPPPPAPSASFASMPSKRLGDLGRATPWMHERTDDPFQRGPEGLAVTVADEMLMRTDGLVAAVGGFTMTPEPRRWQGQPTAEPFGEGPSQLHRVVGRGVVYFEGSDGLHSLDLSDRTPGEEAGVTVREALVFAFEPALAFENGHLSDETGAAIALVHLSGTGKVLLRFDGGFRAMPIPEGAPAVIPVNRLVGWFGHVVPRLTGLGAMGAVELTGAGYALLHTPG